MRVVFAGTPDVALAPLAAVVASGHELVGVVTRPDAPAGRGRRLTPSPVALAAEQLGVAVLKPEHPRNPGFQAALRDLAPDCCPVVAYGALLPDSALEIPPAGWVNLHFSCLPAWRGAAPVQHAIRAGDEVTGATTFRIVAAMDAGPTFGVMTERIRADDTAGTLLARLADGGASLLVATLDGIADGTLQARPQPGDGVSLAPKVTVVDARVDWTAPAPAVDRLIRSCTPAPGAWTEHDGVRLKLGPVRPADLPADVPGAGSDGGSDGGALTPGEVMVTKRDVLVGTATTTVRLGDVQAVGSRSMPAADWARGLRLSGRTRLG